MVIGTMISLNLRVCPSKKESDDDIKNIWSKQYPLMPFVDPSNFKAYDELKEKLNRVIMGQRNTETVENVDLHHKLPQPLCLVEVMYNLVMLVMMTIQCHTLVN